MQYPVADLGAVDFSLRMQMFSALPPLTPQITGATLGILSCLPTNTID